LDHAGFPRAYLLELHGIARYPCRLKFNRRPVISQVRSIAHSPWLNGAFLNPVRRRLVPLRKAVARTGDLQLTVPLDRELAEEVVLFPDGIYKERRDIGGMSFGESNLLLMRSKARVAARSA
jgi:hypothetical protein